MSNQELIDYLVGLGHRVSTVRSSGNVDFIVISGFTLPTGKDAGHAVDVGIQFSTQIPYVAPSAIHVRPPLVAAGTQSSRDSELGSGWQYLSRQAVRVTSPQAMVAHIVSVLGIRSSHRLDTPGLTHVAEELAVSMERHLEEVLESHFDKGPLQEDLTFAYYRLAEGRRRRSLILSRLALPGDGDRNLQGNVAFTQPYLQRVLDECPADAGIALIHSHLGPGWQDMSEDDVVAERDRLASAVGGRTGLPLLGLTWGTNGAWSARVWVRETPFRYRRQDVHHVRVVGSRLRVTFHPQLVPSPPVGKSQVATVSVWGEEAQGVLARVRIGIVGLGSVGSVVAEGLARVGVSNFVLVDHDRIELRNLDRTAGARHVDVRLRRHKVDVAARHIKESATSEGLDLDIYRGSLLSGGGLARILDCDVVFSCVDRPWPRHLMNSVAYANLIPVIDGGIFVRVHAGRLLHADWRIHTVGPGTACLVCLGALDIGDVSLDIEGLLDDPDYMQGLSATQREAYARRNVFPMSLSVAAHELLQLAGLLSGDDRVRGIGPQRYHGYPGVMEVEPRSSCLEGCAYSALTASAIDLSGTVPVK